MPSGVNRVTRVNSIERFDFGGAALLDEVRESSASSRHMVFLHGWGANRDSLRGVAGLFENQYIIHLIDLPGFGEAPPPPSDWDTSKYADLVQQYLAARISGPIVLVGHSFGARVSIRLGARQLPALREVVLMAAPGLPAAPYSRVRLRRSAIRVLRRLLYLIRPVTGPALMDWHTKTFGSTDYLAAGELRKVFVRVVGDDYTEDAKAIRCPVLLLWGGDDRETPPWLAYRFKELMNGHATVEMLPHKDHHLYMGTGAHLCAFKIRAWLEGHDPQ